MSASPPTALPPISPAQFRELLWSDAGSRVHAVVQAAEIPGWEQRLTTRGSGEWDSLWPGALNAEQRRTAPYLVELRPEVELAEWVLFEAAKVSPRWGVLLSSRLDFLPLRSALRAICEVQLPDGRRAPLNWMDPELIAILLPLLEPGQLDEMFRGMDRLYLPDAGGWRRCSVEAGRAEWLAYRVG